MEACYWECECSDFNHLVRFEYDEDDGDLFVTVRMNHYDRWYKRIWNALRYVLKRDTTYGHYDVTLVRERDFAPMHDLLDRAGLRKQQLRALGRLPPLPTDNSPYQG